MTETDMSDDEMVIVRERIAVVETLLMTVVKSVEKLVLTVESLAELVNKQRGVAEGTSRLDSLMIASGAGIAGAVVAVLAQHIFSH
jgi:hypothetical protein